MEPDFRSADILNLDGARRVARARQEAHLSSGGGGGTSDEMEARVAALEKAFEKMDGKLDKILEGLADARLDSEKRFGGMGERLAGIDAKLDAKAATSELAGIVGRVNSLPTTWQLIALVFTILSGAFVILRFGLPHAP